MVEQVIHFFFSPMVKEVMVWYEHKLPRTSYGIQHQRLWNKQKNLVPMLEPEETCINVSQGGSFDVDHVQVL